MNKSDIINSISSKNEGITKKDVTTALEGILSEITDALARGEKVQLIGFGSFETRERAARTGRNPATSEPINIPAKRVPAFKPSKQLKGLINN